MTTLNDLDFGPSHAWLKTRVGQLMGTAVVEGKGSIPYPRGGIVEEQPVDLYVNPWQGLGGNAANTRASLLYLLRQLEELANNPSLQPVYIGWSTTAAPGAFSAVEAHDGWYVITLLQPPYRRYVVTGGTVMVPMTVSMVASGAPASLALWFSGAALSTTYSSPAVPLLAFPLNAGSPPTSSSRVGGEGTIPLTSSPVPNPVPFVRSASVSDLYKCGCRVWDTINSGSNPVPAAPTFVNANWVEVKGTQHDFVGDCVVTNGLLLLFYQVGQQAVPTVYLWNTSLGTPGWQQIGTLNYQETAGSTGTLREVNLDKVGLQEVRVRLTASTVNGNWAELRQKLLAGRYDTYCEFWPRTQSATSQTALVWTSTAVYATGFTDSASSTTFPSNLTPTTVSGYGAAQGSAAGSPIFGFLYQNAPTTAQGRLSTTSLFGIGDTVGPVAGNFTRYGFFAVPYSGAVVLATAQGIVAPIFQQFLHDHTAVWAMG